MMPSPIFQPQTERHHLLQSLLIALSFTSPLQAVYVQSIIAGFIKDEQVYISIQKFRGWLVKRDGLILPSEKTESFLRLCPFTISQSKHEISKQTYHDLLLVRTLFLCLLHLPFEEILEIKKQKYYDTRFIPDITIITRNLTLLIEIDRGKQAFKTLESKIRGLQESNAKATLIYFTDSEKTYSYLTHNFERFKVQCIYLKSPTLAQDLLTLTATNSNHTNDTEANFNEYGNITEINPILDAGQSFYSRIDDTTDATDAEIRTNFQPIEPVVPMLGERKTTIALAPNVLVYDDPMLVKKILEPLPDDFIDALHNLEAKHKHSNHNLQDNSKDILTDALRLLEQDGFARLDDDFD
jgi:hypothetical protein